MDFRSDAGYLKVKRSFNDGDCRCSIYSDNESYVKYIVKELNHNGYPSDYVENGFYEGQYVIKRI